jgi:hypothetical protein
VRAICSKIAAGCFADNSFISTVTWLHFEILGREIDGRLVSTQEILGHLLERRQTEGALAKMHSGSAVRPCNLGRDSHAGGDKSSNWREPGLLAPVNGGLWRKPHV